MTSVVSTVAGGLETPDFLELRKSAARPQAESSDTGPRSLYQVVPEKQTQIRGLMGSERGYDVSGLSGQNVPVLGDRKPIHLALFFLRDRFLLSVFCLGIRARKHLVVGVNNLALCRFIRCESLRAGDKQSPCEPRRK